MFELPKTGYFLRMRIYLAEMYPIPRQLLVAALLYTSIAAFMRSTNQIRTPGIPLFTFVGIWSLFAVALMIRLMDELKDREIDSRLFGARPLPSGRVLESDIRFSLVVVILLYIAANALLGRALCAAFVVLGYSLLMFKHFFLPRVLRENLLLTLATHNLFVPIVYLYVLALFAIENRLTFTALKWPLPLLLVAMYWAMSFAWEIARKIRAPGEETAYVTYSQIFGPTGAVLIACGAQTVSFAIGLYLYRNLSLSPLFLSLLVAGYGAALWGYARFILSPSPLTSNLRPLAEIFIICVLIGGVTDHALLPAVFRGLLG